MTEIEEMTLLDERKSYRIVVEGFRNNSNCVLTCDPPSFVISKENVTKQSITFSMFLKNSCFHHDLNIPVYVFEEDARLVREDRHQRPPAAQRLPRLQRDAVRPAERPHLPRCLQQHLPRCLPTADRPPQPVVLVPERPTANAAALAQLEVLLTPPQRHHLPGRRPCACRRDVCGRGCCGRLRAISRWRTEFHSHSLTQSYPTTTRRCSSHYTQLWSSNDEAHPSKHAAGN